MDFWLFTLTGVFEESFCRKEKIQQSFLGVGGLYRGQARVTPSLGDYVLSEEDINKNVLHEDASFTTSWSIDLHLRTVLIVFISLAMNLKREPYIDGSIPMLCLIAVCIPVM